MYLAWLRAGCSLRGQLRFDYSIHLPLSPLGRRRRVRMGPTIALLWRYSETASELFQNVQSNERSWVGLACSRQMLHPLCQSNVQRESKLYLLCSQLWTWKLDRRMHRRDDCELYSWGICCKLAFHSAGGAVVAFIAAALPAFRHMVHVSAWHSRHGKVFQVYAHIIN